MKILNLKKQTFLVGLIFLFFLLSGCSKQTSLIKQEQTINENNIVQGTYRSVKGVMDPLSCYCFNSGYLITKDNKKVPVCFENNDEDIQCNQIIITGDYKTKKNNPEPTNPCPAGEMTYFNALSHTCN